MSENHVTRRRFAQATGAVGIGALAGCVGGLSTGGGNYPSQKVNMICPWAAGGGTDRTGRELAQLAGNHMDTSFYVTNKTGGTGSVGFNAIANAKPDGYTVGITTVEICTISHLGIADIGPSDLMPVMQYNFDPASITVPKDAPYDTIKEFVNYAKKHPNEIKISNSGSGSIWNLAAAGFAQDAGIKVKHVGYDGAAPATKAVVNGEVQATAASGPEVEPQVNGGPLKVLGIMGDERISIFPKVPTFKQQGYDITIGAWRGLTVPNDTSDDRISKLHDTYKAVYDSSDFKSFMKKNGFGRVYRNTDEFGSFMKSQYKHFGKIIKNLGMNKSNK